MDSLYQEIILEHYKNPHNFGKVLHPTSEASANNPLCGDELFMTLREDKGIIVEIGFEGKGCALSVASASMLTDAVKGKSLEEAKAITPEDVHKMLQVPVGPVRIKCALLPLEVLKKAL